MGGETGWSYEHDHGHGHDHTTPAAGPARHERAHTHGHGDEPDRVALTHIGLDIGTATTKLLACRLVLASHSHGHEDLRVVQRQVIFRSPVLATPYDGAGSLDAARLRGLLPKLWKDAPLGLDAADTRLAVLTGPAAERPDELGSALSQPGFECLVAGLHVGAALAAYGADAVARSVDPHGEPRTIIHAEIGAKVSRLALSRGGEILQTAAIQVGPRLLTLDSMGRLESFERVLVTVAEAAGVSLQLGAELSAAEQKALADELAECLLNVIERRPLQPLTEQLLIGEAFDWSERVNGASFSGGAATYVYGSQAPFGRPSLAEPPNIAARDRSADRSATFGDLGAALGRAIHQRLNRLGFGVQEPEHLLTATIIGSAHYKLEDVHGAPIWTEPPAFAAARARDEMLVHHFINTATYGDRGDREGRPSVPSPLAGEG